MRTYGNILNNGEETINVILTKSNLLGINIKKVRAGEKTGIYAMDEKDFVELVSSGTANMSTMIGFDGEIIFVAEMKCFE